MVKTNSTKYLASVFFLCSVWQIVYFLQAAKHAFLYGLIQSWFVSKGLIFYRDFTDAYLPFLKLLTLPLHLLFGFNQWVTILLSPILSISTLIVLYLLSRKYLSGIARYIPIIIFSIWDVYLKGNQFTTTGFEGFLIILSVYFWLSWVTRQDNLNLFFLGLSASSAIFSMQMVIPVLLILLFSSLLTIRDISKLKSILLYLLLGALIPAIIVVGWFTLNGALADFIYWNFSYYFSNYPYASLGRDPNAVLVLFSLHSLIVPAALLSSSNSVRQIFKSQLVYTFFLLFLFSMPFLFWFAVFHPMRFQISLPAFAFLFGLVWHLNTKLKGSLSKKIISLGLISIIFLQSFTFATNVLPTYARDLSGKKFDFIISKVYPSDPMYQAIEWVKNNTSEKDTIFVIGDTLFYFDAKRLPANSRSTATEPIVYVPLDSLSNELKQKSPNYWIIDERMFLRFSKEWKMPEVTDYFENALSCQKKVVSFDYWSIYEQVNSECL